MMKWPCDDCGYPTADADLVRVYWAECASTGRVCQYCAEQYALVRWGGGEWLVPPDLAVSLIRHGEAVLLRSAEDSSH
jgi:hypothetical protein